ncbi:FecR protein [Anaerohalosphaera lusitana]|uniref:FecR protein n=1 Tax=Anaerohalosphaera lusitana TaxID=1936003 RepID=A0A1U9NIC0_9BACT|nr:hypothetical protein [Anaerohalosphaera lusitana]AQT67673.1 FecR protein [Anaerohalosphaera lusitana]
MSWSKKDQRKLQVLIDNAAERRIDAEGMRELDLMLQTQPQARAFYFEYIQLNECLKGLLCDTGNIELPENDSQPITSPATDMQLWRELLDQERSAQTVVQNQPTQKNQNGSAEIVRPRQQPIAAKRKISKFAIATAVTSLAASFFLIAGIFIAEHFAQQEVATIIDTIDAQWSTNLKAGDRLKTRDDSIRLESGFAELLFDNDAKVVLEGPADIDIITPDQIQLKLGRLYSFVPPQACGFTVLTADSKIMDLGTEFGIEATSNGTVELHVITGKTVLVAGRGKDKSSREVTQQQARTVDPATGQVYNIDCKQRTFARDIDSQQNLVWRGENVNLADIVAGGFNEGTGRFNNGFDSTTGWLLPPDGKNMKQSNGTFNSLLENSYIDGVFSPQPDMAPAVISSTGLIFNECPKTNGRFWRGIFKSKWKDDFQLPADYPYDPTSALSIHPNQGITFDLNAIRNRCEGRGKPLTRFNGVYGISPDALKSKKNITSSIHILVDGKLRLEKIDYKPGQPGVLVDIPINPEDRFLTIISTDGTNNNSLSCWAKIANPILIFED